MCSVFTMRPSSASARASVVGRALTCRTRMMAPAWILPSLSDPTRRSRSSQFQLDELDIDAMAREAVEYAVVGGSVDAPETGVADVCEPWAELVAQEPKQSEHRVCIS